MPAIFTEDVEFIEMPERVDARTFHGHEGVKEAYTRYLDQWDAYSAEVIEVEDHGDQVFAVGLERASGRGSAAPVEDRVHMVFDFRGDKVCRYREFHDRDAALRALGPIPETVEELRLRAGAVGRQAGRGSGRRKRNRPPMSCPNAYSAEGPAEYAIDHLCHGQMRIRPRGT